MQVMREDVVGGLEYFCLVICCLIFVFVFLSLFENCVFFLDENQSPPPRQSIQRTPPPLQSIQRSPPPLQFIKQSPMPTNHLPTIYEDVPYKEDRDVDHEKARWILKMYFGRRGFNFDKYFRVGRTFQDYSSEWILDM